MMVVGWCIDLSEYGQFPLNRFATEKSNRTVEKFYGITPLGRVALQKGMNEGFSL
jgi:hypothetical protein